MYGKLRAIKQRAPFNFLGPALAGFLILMISAGCTTVQPNTEAGAKPKIPGSHSAPSKTMEAKTDPGILLVPYYPPPEQLDLCGEPVPLQRQEVLERFDREFTVAVYNHAQIYLWLKRMERYFPFFEERLRYYNLPDDLKYVAIVESDLLPNATSPKGAAGPWQFMPATGCSYGLESKAGCDQRYDFEAATDCAFRYLNDLYRRYKSWPLAIAAYNCGDKRIQEQMRTLKTSDYYEMQLPTETERYVFRILAVKTVLGNPTRYGYNLPKGQGYPEFYVDRVNLALSQPLSIHRVAAATGTSYREIKRLNPALRGDDIPTGTYELKLPKGTGKLFEQNVDLKTPSTTSAPADLPDEKDRSSVQESRSSKSQTARTETKAQPAPVAVEERQTTVSETSKATPAQAKNSPATKERKTAPTEVKKAAVEEEKRTAAAEAPKPSNAKEKEPKGKNTTTEAARSQPSPAPATSHTVRKGETLPQIAKRYNVSMEELRKANKLKANSIGAGQKLVIP